MLILIKENWGLLKMLQMNLSTIGLVVLLLVLSFVVIYLVGRFQGQKKSNPTELPPDLLTIYQELHNLPTRVLNTIQGSINPQKGKVAELLTYAELRYDYDVIIPLGRPVDFIGIKNGQKIDFIEVKSTLNKNNSGLVLTDEEKEIQKLVKNRQVNFRLVVVKEEPFS